ncbi:MAG: PH domain-containing protein [Clostridia bacterium]|nr:PH domain-containing protein [Clostridia bacterium]
MEQDKQLSEYQRVSPKAVKLWFRQGIVSTVFYTAAGLFFWGVLQFAYALIPSLLLSLYALFVRPKLEYRQWCYRITDRYVDIIHGIFFTTETHIPILRIQHMDISQGPLQKGLGLTSVIIVTAGMSHRIKAIEWDAAQALLEDMRNKIYEVTA